MDETVATRIRSARVGALATSDRDGVPHIVPIVYAMSGHRTLVTAVDAKPKTTHNLKRLRNIADRPRVSVLIDRYDDDDWTALWWIRIDGVARIVTEEAERTQHLAPLIAKYPQYADHPPQGPVVAIDIGSIHGWDAANP